MSNLDALVELDLSLGLDRVQLGQNLARVRGECHEHGQLGERHQTHVGLGVGPELGLRDQVDGVLLRGQPGGQEVAIPHVLRVVHAKKRKKNRN